ncbi:hypothetical protein SeMB42_g05868 [Synchytrium endobioticum]|uniref:Uncharacterized protein n=1 Tax=Synchytrium endobioticum TaxID=286115 RepID=A0A507CNT5_9FUNG|nr:hypothetical protein SeMB42_g05868 [Synchytrium endobioticum]
MEKSRDKLTKVSKYIGMLVGQIVLPLSIACKWRSSGYRTSFQGKREDMARGADIIEGTAASTLIKQRIN